jgi:hypothetical protein
MVFERWRKIGESENYKKEENVFRLKTNVLVDYHQGFSSASQYVF